MARLYSGGIIRITGTADPSQAPGEAAPIGSEYTNTTTGNVYRKTSAPNTGWVLGGSGGGSSNPITLPPVTSNATEDQTLAGNSLTGASTTVGTLSVMNFSIAGQSGVHSAGDTVTITGRGTFSLQSNGAYEFIPNANYNGSVPVITQQVTNGSDIKIGTITITVGAVNDPPVASDDARITLVNTPITFNVLSTDQDPDTGTTLTLTQINGAGFSVGVPVDIGSGTVTVNDNVGNVTVTPDNAFEGSLSFTYTISDGGLTDTATVTVLVGVSNDPMFSAASPISGTIGQAAFNFGLTFRGLIGSAYNNGVNVSIPPYSANQGLFDLANREPWLYDRASTLYALYLRTQDPVILTEAVALADQYMAGVQVSGAGLGTFTIAGGDPGMNPTDVKYLYPIIGVWYELETGSNVHRQRSIALYNQTLLSFSKTYSPTSAALWTERNASYAILNCTAAYWLHRMAGNIAAANTALQDAWDYFTMVESMSAASGAPLHGHNQHEGSAITTPISSPWMSAFLAEAMIQLYRTDPDPRIPNWLANYGDWLMLNAFYATNEGDMPTIQGLRLPAYLAANDQTPTQFREGELLDMEHAADVAGLIKKVIWAKTLLSESVVAFNTLLGELEFVAGEVFTYWTRLTEGYPRYRVNPPRKYGWWFRNAYSDTSLFFTAQVPTKPLNTVAVVINGSTQQGQTLTATPGTWDAFPAPTITYQWTRNGANIGGATNSTYVTQAGDIGTTVRCVETATNAAGATSTTSNGINVVAAGAPEITQHPSNDTALVGETAQFSAACNASPTATFQWQVSTNGGGAWSNVVGGTGGSGTGNSTTYTTPTLVEGDDGNLYRCQFTNAGGTSTTNSASLSLTIDQGAARFDGNAQGAELTFDLGAAGHSDLVIEALLYFEDNTDSAIFMGVRHLGNGRALQIQTNNAFPEPLFGAGDSQTGVTVWATQPPLNTWLHVTIQCQTTGGGDQVRATWTVAEGAAGTRHAVTRANGIENSVQAQAVFVGGGAIGPVGQGAVRAQYVRGRTGFLDDATVDGHRQDVDTTGWAFWWRFYNNGGALAVEDKTGNNRVPTIEGGTFVAGPVVPGVP